MMTSHVGVIRNSDRLRKPCARSRHRTGCRQHRVAQYGHDGAVGRDGRHGRGAESRGAHFRSDYPTESGCAAILAHRTVWLQWAAARDIAASPRARAAAVRTDHRLRVVA